MARPRSARVNAVQEKIRTRLRAGVYRPGDRFLSTREAADAFGISYETAHRILGELCAEGLLERRAASGTYIPGGAATGIDSVQLLFSPRARRPNSFGARLLSGLTRRLERDRIGWEVSWADLETPLYPECFPVLWEAPGGIAACERARHPALLLNDRPRPGLDAALFDSVSMDDFSGGASAAELLRRVAPAPEARLAVLSGPADDGRSRARVAGFRSVAEGAAVVACPSWYFEDGYRVAEAAVAQGGDGLFCANDRLAQAVTSWCADHRRACPPLVGFDDAPIAEEMGLTTIAIPWEEMLAAAVEVIKRRLSGDASAGRQMIVTPRPVVRRLPRP